MLPASERLGLLTTDPGLKITASFAGDAAFKPSTDIDFRTRLIAP